MRDGIPYFGIMRAAAHGLYLPNTLDRDALSVITHSASALYEADVVEHVRQQLGTLSRSCTPLPRMMPTGRGAPSCSEDGDAE